MKKILGAVVAGSMALSSLSALEVYRDGDNFVNITGTVRGVLGYGESALYTPTLNASKTTDSKVVIDTKRDTTHQDILFGLQTNSRVGLEFNYNGFFGGAMVAAGEKTLQTSNGDFGFRQAYAGYDFGSAGKLLVGKIETLTTEGNNFSSDFFDTDSGANGFGGSSTSTRRFQVRYTLPFGLSIALSEKEFGSAKADTDGFVYTKNNSNIPSVALSYDLNNENLAVKVAARYAHFKGLGGNGTTPDEQSSFKFIAGVKPTFGKAYVSALFGYAYNGHLMSESRIAAPGIKNGMITHDGTYDIAKAFEAFTLPGGESIKVGSNTNYVNILLEGGYDITESLRVVLGAGYQFANAPLKATDLDVNPMVHSYSVYAQLPYAVSKNFSIVPQIGYYGVGASGSVKVAGQKASVEPFMLADGVFGAVQAKFNF